MITKSKTEKAAAKPKPTLHIQVGGVRIPIWKNKKNDGDGFYYKAGEPELSYKGRDGNWGKSKSYGQRELIHLIKAAALAHSTIGERNRAELTTDAPDPEDAISSDENISSEVE